MNTDILQTDLGRTTVARLESIGIESRRQLLDVGAMAALRSVQDEYPDERSMPVLFAHQGALLDLHWHEQQGPDLPPAA